jgi:hypothetical protein
MMPHLAGPVTGGAERTTAPHPAICRKRASQPLLSVILMVVLLSSHALAQAKDTVPLDIWGSLAVGSANGPDANRVGLGFTLWGARGIPAVAVRASTSAYLLDVGHVADYSLLLGARVPRRNITAVGAAGIGVSSGTTGGPQVSLPYAAILAYSGELTGSFNHIGVGFSIFGAAGEARRSYTAIALVIQVGRLH